MIIKNIPERNKAEKRTWRLVGPKMRQGLRTGILDGTLKQEMDPHNFRMKSISVLLGEPFLRTLFPPHGQYNQAFKSIIRSHSLPSIFPLFWW